MHTVPRIIGAAAIAITVWAGIAISPGASYGAFINLPSLAWVLGIVLGGLLISSPPRFIAEAFHKCFTGYRDTDSRYLSQHVSVFSRAYQLTWGAGIAGTLLGLIIMLGNLDNPEAVGPGMAISLLSLFYAAILAEIVLKPLQQGLISSAGQTAAIETETQGVATESGRAPTAMIGTALAVLFVVMLQFVVMLTSLDSSASNSASSLQVAMPAEDVDSNPQAVLTFFPRRSAGRGIPDPFATSMNHATSTPD